MCSTPPPISDFGDVVMSHIVSKRFDLMDRDIQRFRKRGYILHCTVISEKDQETNFFDVTGDSIRAAKEKSKGWKYNGVLLFFPRIQTKNWVKMFNPYKPSTALNYWNIVFDFSRYFNNNSCISNRIMNSSGKICRDKNLYLMTFYFKGGVKMS